MEDVAVQQNLEQELAKLETADTPTLRAQWRELYGHEAPPRASKTLMKLAVAYRMQERVYGGLSAAARRELKEIALQSNTWPHRKKASGQTLTPGTQLVREFKGELHEVTVLDDGFAYRGRQFTSLSKVANVITGAHWSGPAFFGLNNKPAR